MEEFDNHILLNVNLLKITGLMPFEKGRLSWLSHLMLGTVLLSMSFLSLPCIYNVIFNWNSFAMLKTDESLECICLIFLLSSALAKVVFLLCRRGDLLQIIERSKFFHDSAKNSEERLAVAKFASKGKRITKVYLLMVMSTDLVFFVAAIVFSPQPPLAENGIQLRTPLPFLIGDVQESPLYEVLFAIELITSIYSVVGLVAADTVVSVLILHACGELRLVQYRLNRFNEASRHTKEYREKGKNLTTDQSYLRWIINYHMELMEHCAHLESIFNLITMLQLFASVVNICLPGVNLMIDSLENFLKYSGHVCGGVIQLLIFCWPPNDLITESEKVAEAAYNVHWYNFEPCQRLSVGMIIMRAQRRAEITAANWKIMSLETFMTTLSTTLSGFTVLRATLNIDGV